MIDSKKNNSEKIGEINKLGRDIDQMTIELNDRIVKGPEKQLFNYIEKLLKLEKELREKIKSHFVM